MTKIPERQSSGHAGPPATSQERISKIPPTGSGLKSGLQPCGVTPGGGPAGAGQDNMGKSKKSTGKRP